MIPAAHVAIQRVNAEARSALPHAPVVPFAEPRRTRVRVATAAVLRRAADRLEPATGSASYG